jgi:23S rRNA (adenine2503-C2)-methyltransferase
MSSLSKDLRQQLDNHYHISYGDVTKDSVAHDGTRKFLVGFGEHQVESVFIPETQRGTLCVSSQVGCSLSCTFCHTGTQGLSRNLKAEEIIGQLMNAKKILYDFPTREERTLSNIVFMGQGEPVCL